MSRSARKLHVTVFVMLTLLISLAGSLGPVRPAFAAGFQLSGKVTDQSSALLAAATITVSDPATSATVASAPTDAGGNYALTILSGTYNV
jgi:hypothetical protein